MRTVACIRPALDARTKAAMEGAVGAAAEGEVLDALERVARLWSSVCSSCSAECRRAPAELRSAAGGHRARSGNGATR